MSTAASTATIWTTPTCFSNTQLILKMEDQVELELEVVLNKTFEEELALLQYPLRPRYRPYGDQGSISKASLSANSLELTYDLQKASPNYDKTASDFSVSQQTLKSQKVNPLTNYCVAVIQNNKLYMVPINYLYQMRPAMDYVDKETQQKVIQDPQEDQEAKAEKEARKLRVYKKQKSETKPQQEETTEVKYFSSKEKSSHQLFQSLFNTTLDPVTTLDQKTYQQRIMPPRPEVAGIREKYLELPLSLQVEEVLSRAEVGTTEFFLELVNSKDEKKLTDILSQKCYLIQDKWVCKSELIYQDHRQKARDLCLETLQAQGYLEKPK